MLPVSYGHFININDKKKPRSNCKQISVSYQYILPTYSIESWLPDCNFSLHLLDLLKSENNLKRHVNLCT